MGQCLSGDSVPNTPKEIQADPTLDEETKIRTMCYGTQVQD